MIVDLTQNCTAGRAGNNIKAIVLHVTEGSYESALAWTHDSRSSASYHYIIAKDGSVTQTVSDSDTAWHAGKALMSTWPGLITNVNPNLYTLSIARAGFAKDKATPQQIDGICKLIAALSTKHNIVLNNGTIVFHREIRGDKSCPGLMPDKSALIAGANYYKLLNNY